MEKIELRREVAKALYERLLTPENDKDGNKVYTISLMLAREIREDLFEGVGK